MRNERNGLRFEKQVLETLRNMGIKGYEEHGQIQLQELHPQATPGEHLEIDIVCLVGNICILVETTTDQNRNSNKIRRFIRHCDLIADSTLRKQELFRLFSGIPQEELVNFAGVSDWRYLYIGTSLELITNDITPANYPDTDRLHILNVENWEYFRVLARTINQAAQYEFLDSVGIKPSDIGDAALGGTSIEKPYLELTNKTLFSGQTDVLADLFIVTFTPEELLRIARVLRYQGQPLAISAGSSTNQRGGGYQRILIPDKLKKIHDFVNNDPRVAFPTNLTLVLSSGCERDNDLLRIPSKYASIDVIDGQHRLFSYALADEQTCEEANLIATAIKFKTDNEQEINRHAAGTFLTINSEQTKVKRDLLYLISYDVLGDKSPESIAAKILKECDSRDRLSNIFALSAFIKKNRFGQPPIPIISIVKELARIAKQEKLEAITLALDEQVNSIGEVEELIQRGVQLLEQYFYHIIGVFSDDWGKEDSLLMCANYIGAFMRLLSAFVDEKLTTDQIRQVLEQMKQNIFENYNEGRSQEDTFVFNPNAFRQTQNGTDAEGVEDIPSKKDGISNIYKFLDKNRPENPQS